MPLWFANRSADRVQKRTVLAGSPPGPPQAVVRPGAVRGRDADGEAEQEEEGQLHRAQGAGRRPEAGEGTAQSGADERSEQAPVHRLSRDVARS